MSLVHVRPCHYNIMTCLGTTLSVMYLVLGLAFSILYILLSETQVNINLHKSYTVLAVILLILFTGFLTSMMLIVSVKTDKRYFILPWLVFHLIVIFVMVVGGTTLLLHFVINKKQFRRATLCSIPIVTGLLFIFIWMKVYQKMFLIKSREKKRKALEMHNLYTNTYFPFNPELKLNPQEMATNSTDLHNYSRSMNIYSQPNDAINEAEKMKRKLAAHEYTHYNPDQESLKSVAIVRTRTEKSKTPVYYFGDPLGFLTWKNSQRTFETLEASITFEEEEEVYNKEVYDIKRENVSSEKKDIEKNSNATKFTEEQVKEEQTDQPNSGVNILTDKVLPRRR